MTQQSHSANQKPYTSNIQVDEELIQELGGNTKKQSFRPDDTFFHESQSYTTSQRQLSRQEDATLNDRSAGNGHSNYRGNYSAESDHPF